MIRFKVIDITTGREVSSEKIDKIAKENELMDMDIDQFYIGEDGTLILADDCGNTAYCDIENQEVMPVLKGKYPDLEYLEALLLENLRSLHPEAFTESFWRPQVELIGLFPQTWPNTAGGFSEPGMMSGQAFTTQFTAVMRVYVHDTKEEYYGVFFDNKPAYIVDNANEAFLKDLKEHNLKTRYDAQEAYRCLFCQLFCGSVRS